MKSSALARLESLLQSRKLDTTLAWTSPGPVAIDAIPTGVPAVDAVLRDGGWRRGEVSELIGPRSSGRTTVLVSTLAAAARQGEVVALVDALDRFDPVTAAAAGLDLERVLWIRGCTTTVDRVRRGRRTGAGRSMLFDALQRSVRALDLVIRAGGFAVAALDVADVPARVLRELPWTTWMRLAHANEGRRTVCLLVGDAPMGKSARGASVRLAASPQWAGDSLQSRRFAGLGIRVA
jgi:RecA/RadA recombinase